MVGASNEVWLTDHHVVRVSAIKGDHLIREARVLEHLPASAAVGEVVATGSEAGHDWMVTTRQPGEVLSGRWPLLSPADRRRAVHELAEQLRAVHSTSAEEVLGVPPDPPHPLGGPDPTARLQQMLGEARRLPNVPGPLINEVAAAVEEAAPTVTPWPDATLVHGDVHFKNVLWDGHVTGLIDFEWTRPGPPDLDLDVFLRFCADPALHIAAGRDGGAAFADYDLAPKWLAEAYPELFQVPRERLRLFAISYEVRALLLDPPTDSGVRLHPEHPVNRLARDYVYGGHLRFLA